MLSRFRSHVIAVAILTAAASSLDPRPAEAQASTRTSLGLFRGDSDVGRPSVLGPGKVQYDPSSRTYAITGGGANMWATSDHFHYVWIKVSGDAALEATIRFTGTTPSSGTPDPHRKACLVIRQSLDSDSPYADAATHGDGLTSLQWRDTKGAVTHEVQTDLVRPTRLRVEKRGGFVTMSVATGTEPLHPAGGAAKLQLTGDYYIGLAVSAHDTTRLETAEFSRVVLSKLAVVSGATTLVSTLETISLRSRDRRVAYVVRQPERIESPTWFPDSSRMLYFNTRGRLYRVQADVPGRPLNPQRLAVPQEVPLGLHADIHGGHGVTRDGRLWAIGDETSTSNGTLSSVIHVVPAAGGVARRVTGPGRSYFHGWAPDGSRLAFTGVRGGNLDVYTIAADGGAELRLTTGPERDDGPEYSPDGEYIYFHSDRTGRSQIWRMRVNGSAQEQLTNDAMDNRFAHVSPDGKSIVFLSSEPGAESGAAFRDVQLRVMTLATRAIDEIAQLTGGQGTINAYSWSPDSQYLAFVSYQVAQER
ncbi:MAG: hypothetical protein ABI601_04555 [bacterium]